MNFKTFGLVVVLGVLCFAVYVSLNHNADTGSTPPPGVPEGADSTLSIQMPGQPSTFPPGDIGAGPNAGGPAPPFGPEGHTDPTQPGGGLPGTGPLADYTGGYGDPAGRSPLPPPGTGPSAPGAGDSPSDPFPPGQAAGGSASQFDTVMANAQQRLSQDLEANLAETLLALSAWFDHPSLSPQQSQMLVDFLDFAAGKVVYSPKQYVGPAYRIQPGEDLEQIARMHDVPWQLLAKINGISDPRNLPVGRELKVVRGPFRAEINLSKLELTLFAARGYYAGRFAIGLGGEETIPEGRYEVRNKIRQPRYYGLDGVTVEASDPSNPLGQHWIGLRDSIGIHGTDDPANVGRTTRRGWICLDNRDVDDLYDILSVSSVVIVRR